MRNQENKTIKRKANTRRYQVVPHHLPHVKSHGLFEAQLTAAVTGSNTGWEKNWPMQVAFFSVTGQPSTVSFAFASPADSRLISLEHLADLATCKSGVGTVLSGEETKYMLAFPPMGWFYANVSGDPHLRLSFLSSIDHNPLAIADKGPEGPIRSPRYTVGLSRIGKVPQIQLCPKRCRRWIGQGGSRHSPP